MPNFENLQNKKEQSVAQPPVSENPPIKPGEIFDPREALAFLKKARLGVPQLRVERAALRQKIREKLACAVKHK